MENIKLEIKQTSKAKRMIIRVLSEGIVRVTAPKRARKSDIDDVLKNSQWIQKNRTTESVTCCSSDPLHTSRKKFPFKGSF